MEVAVRATSNAVALSQDVWLLVLLVPLVCMVSTMRVML